MAVFPFAYNPVTKTLRVYYNMTVEMYKVDNKGENVIETRRSNEVKMSSDFKSVYQRHFLNYEAGMAKYTALDEEGDLLIICYDNFISNMTDFVNWKKTRGINTTIVGTSTAGSSYSAIQTYIKNQYNANNNITHVLLVGDVAQIPGYTYSGGGSSYSGKGDNAYGQIVGSDNYNDVFIGRFSASTAARVTTQCNRVITYERDLTTSASWLQVAEGIAKKEGGSGHNGEDDYQHMDVIRTDLLNYGYSTVYQRYENLSGYTATASQISSDINSGVGIINYCNHGAETMWGVASYSVSHVNALTNENKLPFIWSVACLVGKYDHSSDCFAEAWMNATNNNNPTGAIGTLMSYISQPWIPPMWAQDECVDILAGLSSSGGTKHTWGGVSINGLFGIFDNYGSDQSAVGTYQAWILYGDPSMLVRTKTPTSMTVTHDGTIAPSATSYQVNVTNGNGAVATITDANHNILGKATVSNNKATISISGTLTVGTELTLCVYGFNKVTQLSTISVQGGTQYTITAQASPTAGGTVSGGGTYYENTSCTLTATPNTHYEFTKWTKNGTQVSTNATYTFTVTGTATYVANFTALTAHTITCATVNHGTVYANATSAYKGDIITLSSSPEAGYFFSAWSVKDASNNTITVTNNQFTMPDSNVTVSATFVPGYNITLASVMNGTISADAEGGPQGTTIHLTATPASSYVFDSWLVYKTGDVNTTVTVSNNAFTMPAYDVTVVAFFSAPSNEEITIGSTNDTIRGWTLPTHVYYNYSLTQQIYTAAEIGGAGTITAISFYYLGSSATGTASSSGARTFDIYMSSTSSSNLDSWINETSSHKVYTGSQTFNSVGWYTFTLNTPFEYDGTSNLLLTFDDNTGSYSVTSRRYFQTYSTGQNRARYVCGDDDNFDPTGATSISSGAYNVTITANNKIKLTKEVSAESASIIVSPTTLSDFTYAEAQGPSASKTVTLVGANLEANVTVTAPASYEVCLTSNGTYASSLSITPTNGNVQKMVYVRLKAGLAQGTYNNQSLTFTSGSATQTVTLNGEVTQGDGTYYAITVEANPEAGGTVTGGNTYKEGTQATLTATANSGYTFQNWTLNGSVVSSSATYSFTVYAAGNYVANFTRNSYMIQVSANPAAGGTVTGGGTYYEGTPVNIVATANTGYAFVNWTKNGTVVSTEPSYNFFVGAGGSYVANFQQLVNYSITVVQANGGTISANPTNAYPGDVIDLTVTTDNGYFFSGWNVTYGNNQPVEVSDNQFVMPNGNVTVTASFAQGFVITMADVTNGTISANKDNALPGETITLTATPETNYYLTTWLVFQTGDVRNTVPVTNNQFTMPEYDVTVFAIFKMNEIEEVTVGSGSSTNQYLPTYAYYKYCITQQIYTADEIGSAGNITAIAFKVSNSKSVTRTLDVYLKHTTKTEFTSRKDWVACSSSDKVFTGSVTFLASGWTTITFDTPFEYDGESNLLICVDDNSNSDVSSSSNASQFYVYSTNANRALRLYNDYTNYNPASLSTNGTYVTSNNQITFTISHPSSGASITATPTNMSGFSYVEGQGPSEVRSFAVIGVDLTHDITVTAPEDFEIANAINGTFGSTVTLTAESKGRETISYDFEDGYQGWTVLKGTTGDSPNNWMHNTEYPTSNNDFSTGYGYNSSDGFMLSESYISGTSNGTGTAVTPDNYLISPQVPLGGSVTFQVGVQNVSYCAEKFSLMVSTTNNTNINAFTAVQTWTYTTTATSGSEWQEYTVDLSAYSGNGYIAIRHFDCNNEWILKIDNVTINDSSSVDPDPDPTEPVIELLTANVYARLKADLAEGTYANETAVVTTDDISVNVNLNGEVLSGDVTYYTITVSADPAEGGTVTGGGRYEEGTAVYLTATPNEGYHFVNWTLNNEVACVNPTCFSTATEDRTYVAHFELNSYEVTTSVNPANAGTATGDGTFVHGNNATLTTTANTGYTFANWTKDGTVVSTDATYTFAVTEAAEYVANFTLNTYAVTATADPAVGGSIIGTGSYEHGSTATLTATPATGYFFINWTLNNEEVGTELTYSFTVNEATALVAHFGLAATQTVHLNSAWNWFSTYIDLQGAEGLATLENALGTTTTQIKGKNGYVNYSNGTWMGSLNSYDPTQMYEIRNSSEADITIIGSIINPADCPITIANGWNWVAYPVSQPMDINVALENCDSREEDVIKSRSSFSTYIDGYGWWGSLNTLNPGEGYRYNALGTGTQTFVYNDSRSELRDNITTDGNYWTPDADYAGTINVMASIPADAVVNANETVEIGAFVNGECRGSAKLMYVEPLDQYIAFMTVYGENDDVVTFNIYNEGNQFETEEEVVFTDNAIVGKATAPFMLHISTTNSLSCFPNPVNKGEQLTVELNGQVDLNGATLQVYNTVGSLIRTESISQSSKTIEGMQTSGIYTVKVTDAQGNVYFGKVVVR